MQRFHLGFLSLVTCGLLLGTGCGDDAAEPGTLAIPWSLAPISTVTCETWGLKHIEVRAIRGSLVEDRVTQECAASEQAGEVVMANLLPGAYVVEVEGLDAAGIARYQGSTGTMTLQEGQTIKAPTVQLALKSASVAVDWTLPGGGKCSTAMVDSVTAQLFDTSGNWQSLEINVDCDSTFADPDDDGNLKGGVLFQDIPVPDMDGMEIAIVLSGYNERDEAIATGEIAAVRLLPGDRQDHLVELE